MKFGLVMVSTICLMFSTVAHAKDKAPLRPSEIPAAITSPEPYGTGQLSRLMFVAYDAALWMDASPWSYAKPFALTLTYRMSFSRDELVERTIAEMVGQEEIAAADQSRYRAFLDKAFVDVAKKDRFTAVFIPNGTLRLYHNGGRTGEIKDAVFAKRFMDIWLSEKTSEPSLRRALLGAAGE